MLITGLRLRAKNLKVFLKNMERRVDAL